MTGRFASWFSSWERPLFLTRVSFRVARLAATDEARGRDGGRARVAPGVGVRSRALPPFRTSRNDEEDVQLSDDGQRPVANEDEEAQRPRLRVARGGRPPRRQRARRRERPRARLAAGSGARGRGRGRGCLRRRAGPGRRGSKLGRRRRVPDGAAESRQRQRVRRGRGAPGGVPAGPAVPRAGTEPGGQPTVGRAPGGHPGLPPRARRRAHGRRQGGRRRRVRGSRAGASVAEVFVDATQPRRMRGDLQRGVRAGESADRDHR